jgi:hypothetical protein
MLPIARVRGKKSGMRYMGFVGSNPDERMRYIGEPVTLIIDITLVRATIVDIEFESGVGPIFLLDAGRIKFWLTRKQLKEYEIRTNNN